jgi:hypothetical protein
LKRIPRVRICGDDLVGVTEAHCADEYERLARESGAKFSGPDKHLRETGGGVFTEEVFTTSGAHPTEFQRWSEAFPLRGILGTLRTDRTGREEPYWMSMGPALEKMMEERGKAARRRILHTVRRAHPELKPFLRSRGLLRLWHIPRQFGGLGVPTIEMWGHSVHRSTAEVHQAALIIVKSSAWDDDLQKLSRPYDTSLPTTLPIREVAGRMAEMAIGSRYQVVRRDAEPPIGWFEVPGSVDQVIEGVQGNVARDIFFLSEFTPPKRGGLKQRESQVATKLAASLHRIRREIISQRGGWLYRKRAQGIPLAHDTDEGSVSEDAGPTVESTPERAEKHLRDGSNGIHSCGRDSPRHPNEVDPGRDHRLTSDDRAGTGQPPCPLSGHGVHDD